MKYNNPQAGYVALITVLIVGAAATAIATTLLVTGTDSSREVLAVQQSVQARSVTNACADEALLVMHDNTAYTGTSSFTVGSYSCSYTVTSTGSTTRTIDTTATINNVTRKTKIYVTIAATSLSITSWQEVS